ncbi:hypothetical protein DKL51_20015 [Micromonospora globispora]|nr:hypothetical protein DKL51_20015 [Micromonospora globispora]
MQINEAARRRERWRQAGSPPCAHEQHEREYYLGSDTGDNVCTDCGAIWTRGEPKPGPYDAQDY